MKHITSPENQIWKGILKLTQKKYRDSEGLYLIEGPNLLKEAFKNEAKVRTVIYRSSVMERLTGEYEEIIQEAQEFSESQILAEGRLFDKLADTATPQGVMAVVEKKIWSKEAFFSAGKPDGVRPGCTGAVVLDRLQDPGNIGTVLRTADAAGFLGVIAVKGCGDLFGLKVIRAAAGSLFRMPLLYAESPEEAGQIVKDGGMRLICAAPRSEKHYFDVDMKGSMALVIGNEGNGACDYFLDHADEQVKIPMTGTVESLNASVAAGIIMYEKVRQLQGK